MAWCLIKHTELSRSDKRRNFRYAYIVLWFF